MPYQIMRLYVVRANKQLIVLSEAQELLVNSIRSLSVSMRMRIFRKKEDIKWLIQKIMRISYEEDYILDEINKRR